MSGSHGIYGGRIAAKAEDLAPWRKAASTVWRAAIFFVGRAGWLLQSPFRDL